MSKPLLHLNKDAMSSTKNFLIAFFTIALPVILQQLVSVSLVVYDNFAVGHLGLHTVAGVGFADRIVFIFILTLFGATGGCGIFIAQYYGKQEFGIIKKIFTLMLILALIIAFIFTAICVMMPERIISLFTHDSLVITKGVNFLTIIAYSFPLLTISFAITATMRSMGETKIPLYIALVTTIVNAIFNYILINGKLGFPVMEERGSATATLIARTLECVIFVLYMSKYADKYHLKGKLKEYFGLGKTFIKSILKISIPIFFTEFIWVIGTASLMAAFGIIGTEEAAAVQISDNVFHISSILFMGVATASSIMVAQAIGTGDNELALLISKKILQLANILGIACIIISLLLTKVILLAYVLPQSAYDKAFEVLIIMSFILYIKMQNWTMIIGILRAGGDTKVAFFIDTVFLLCYAIPVAFILAIFYPYIPVYIILIIINIEEVMKYIVARFRYKSKKWINNLTQMDKKK